MKLWATTLFVFLMCHCKTTNGKSWTFAMNGNRRPYNFIDKDGYLKGSDPDLIKEVCQIAGKKCFVTVQPTEECVKNIEGKFYPGEGLMEGWFDGCMGYVSSPERENSVAFTDAFRTQFSTFAVQRGNPKGFDPKQISKSIITHLSGAYTNQQCLVRLELGQAKRVIVASGIKEARALMLNGTADALFSPRTTFKELDVLPQKFRCDSGGTGVMVKKGSDLPKWWNPAFQKFYRSGKYNQHCNNIKRKYGGIGDPTRSCLFFNKTTSIPSSSTDLHHNKPIFILTFGFMAIQMALYFFL